MGNTMEGCIPTNHIGQFKEQLKEDPVYTLESFIVADALKKYKMTDHPFRIKITQSTKVHEVVP